MRQIILISALSSDISRQALLVNININKSFSRLGGQFSLAGFAHNLSQWISDSSLVVDIRDCWSIDIVFDQELLYLPSSDLFRPDINILEINIENIDQVIAS